MKLVDFMTALDDSFKLEVALKVWTEEPPYINECSIANLGFEDFRPFMIANYNLVNAADVDGVHQDGDRMVVTCHFD